MISKKTQGSRFGEHSGRSQNVSKMESTQASIRQLKPIINHHNQKNEYHKNTKQSTHIAQTLPEQLGHTKGTRVLMNVIENPISEEGR